MENKRRQLIDDINYVMKKEPIYTQIPKDKEARGLLRALVEMTDQLILVREETREETINRILDIIDPIIAAFMTADPPEYFVRCIKQIRNAIYHLPPEPEIDVEYILTKTERIVAQKVAQGATTKEIASELFISPRTVETHRNRIRRKLGLKVGDETSLEKALKNLRFE